MSTQLSEYDSMKTFKAVHHVLKQHQDRVRNLVNQVVNSFSQGEVPRSKYELPGYKWIGRGANTRTRVSFLQSPGPGAVAIQIVSGREYIIKVYCTQTNFHENTYACEAFWYQGLKELGQDTFCITTNTNDISKAA